MSILLRGFIFASGLFLILATLRSLIRRGLSEWQSLFWIFCGLVLILISLFPVVAYMIADVFNVAYVPSIFFAIAIILAMYGIFYCFKAITSLQNRVHELAMQVSLLNQENSRPREGDERPRMEEVCAQLPTHESKKA
jgi:hypothetical protein